MKPKVDYGDSSGATPEQVEQHRRSSTLVIEDGRYTLGMWYVELPPVCFSGVAIVDGEATPYVGGNLLIGVWRMDDEPTKWHLSSRYRHYLDEKVHASADVRSGQMEVLVSATEDEMIALMDAQVAQTVAAFQEHAAETLAMLREPRIRRHFGSILEEFEQSAKTCTVHKFLVRGGPDTFEVEQERQRPPFVHFGRRGAAQPDAASPEATTEGSAAKLQA